MSFACCHSSFTVLTPSKVRPAMWLFSSKLPIHSVRFFVCLFFIYYNSYYFCLQCMSTTGQFSCTDSLPFKDRTFVVLSIWSILRSKSNRSKSDEHWSRTFPIKQGKMFHFWMLKSIISYKSVTCQTEIQSLGFFSIFGFDHANPTR